MTDVQYKRVIMQNQQLLFNGGRRERGITLMELLISSMLSLLIIGFVIATLFEFFATEKMVTSQQKAYQNAHQALNNIKKSVELSGYIKTNSLSLLSSWNYLLAPSEQYVEGEIIKVANTHDDLLRMRVIGDDYAPFYDCLGEEFSFPDAVFIQYSLKDEQLYCKARHITSAGARDRNLPVASDILRVQISVLSFDTFSETWRFLKNTTSLANKKSVKGILVEILAASDIPSFNTSKKQTFRFFGEDVDIESNRKVVYVNEIIPIANQEQFDDI